MIMCWIKSMHAKHNKSFIFNTFNDLKIGVSFANYVWLFSLLVMAATVSSLNEDSKL